MANLDNLISKILEDANNKAKEIIDEAKKREARIIEDSINKAEEEKEEIINKSHLESSSRKERVISNAKLEARNNKLRTKQQLIDDVFTRAEQVLEEISQEEYNEFVKNCILSMDINGDEEIIVSSNYKNVIGADLLNLINGGLKTKGKVGELKISSQNRDIKGGFILYKNGVEINCTFEALVFSLRDELEDKILGVLFN